MSNSASIRKRVSFTPIMLTSKSIRPVDRSHYELNRNQHSTSKMRNHRQQLTNFIFRDSKNYEHKELYEHDQSPSPIEGCVYNEDEEEGFRKLVRKMTTPAVVRVQFQKQLIKSKKGAELKLKKWRQNESLEDIRSEMNRAMYYTNARTFEQFTKINKIKTSKKVNQIEEEDADEKWKKYLDKYYLSIRKVKPILKKDEGMRLLSPQKINEIKELHHRIQERSRESVDLVQPKSGSPLRSITKRDGKIRDRGHRGNSHSVCEPMRPLQEANSPEVYKRIEQDIICHRTQTKKEFFVFGLSENTNKPNEANQIKLKMDAYWDFLFRVNFTNGLYVCSRDEGEKLLKFYVGFGNNSALVKGVMRRRPWWQLVDKSTDDINFAWTQLKISDFFKSQRKNKTRPQMYQSKNDKDDEDPSRALMAGQDLILWERYYNNNMKSEQKSFQAALGKRAAYLLKGKKIDVIESSSKVKVHNHLQCNYFLGNKKALFYSMKKYYELKGFDPFTKIPLTFHITQGLEDPEFQKFLNIFQDFNEKRRTDKDLRNIWIIKPGELTNRGRGITVCSTLDEIKIRLKAKQKNSNGTSRTFIIQKYIQKPLLYQRRKFDIRHYMAMSCTNGRIKGYWYSDGYVRTTSSQYNIKNTKDLFTHLTNDAVQKNGQNYGKFQKGNKVSYPDFRKYLMNTLGSEVDFYDQILPKMKELATDTMKATYMMLDPQRKEHNFQLFGLDFMLDEQLNVYLIEVNTNPCLETSCPLLVKLLIPLIENLFKLCLDPLYPPPVEWPAQKKYSLGDNAFEDNKFSLVFDECQNELQLQKLYKNAEKIDERMGDIFQEDEEYNDEEKQWNEEEEACKK